MRTKLAVINILFIAAVVLTAVKYDVRFDTLTLVSLGLAASLVGRAVAFLKIGEWIRAPWTVVKPHPSGVGEYVDAKNDHVLGHLLSCPVCAGTWAAEILTEVYILFPNVGRLFILVLAASAISWFVWQLTSFLEWNASYNWEGSGFLRTQNKIVREREDMKLWEDALK